MPRTSDSSGDPHWDHKHDILRNVSGKTDQAALDKLERNATTAAIYSLRFNPVRGNFDRTHLESIHKRIFEKVYPWAGELRHVSLRRRASYPFSMVPFIRPKLDQLFRELAEENHLKNLHPEVFAKKAANYMGRLNSIHPFREGNGRTQREFIRELASNAGHQLNWDRITPTQMYEASELSHNSGNHSGLAVLIRTAIEPDEPEHAPEPARRPRIIYKRAGRGGKDR